MGWKFLAWPTDHKIVTQAFGARPWYYSQFGLPGHEGVDIRAPMDSPIYAIQNGTVVYAGILKADGTESKWGWHVIIKHDCGYSTIYAHLANDGFLPLVGEEVLAGQRIGTSGNTGNSEIAHLHFTLKHKDGQVGWPYNIVDPTRFIEELLQGE